MSESDAPDVQLSAAAEAIFDVCFTLAPISFHEARRRDTLHYQRAIRAAERARDSLVVSGSGRERIT